jgi:hypothetical protein
MPSAAKPVACIEMDLLKKPCKTGPSSDSQPAFAFPVPHASARRTASGVAMSNGRAALLSELKNDKRKTIIPLKDPS